MEPTKFNLKNEIADYLNRANINQSLTASDFKELEEHFYASVEDLSKAGLSTEEAFAIARKRLGNERVISDEYAKVNVSVETNKIWAYLLSGLAVFYLLPKLYFTIVNIIYYYSFFEISNDLLQGGAIVLINIITICIMCLVLKSKQNISLFVEKTIAKYPVRLVLFNFLLVGLTFKPLVKLESFSSFTIPVYQIQNPFVEFSFYVMLLSVCLGIIILMFSISFRNLRNISIKAFLEKPNPIYLLIFGFFIELLAASTRALRFGESHIGEFFTFFLFGIIYFFGAYLITKYNVNHNVKLLLIFAALGFILELAVGIQADMYRPEIYTPYFISALVIGVILGSYASILRCRVLQII